MNKRAAGVKRAIINAVGSNRAIQPVAKPQLVAALPHRTDLCPGCPSTAEEDDAGKKKPDHGPGFISLLGGVAYCSATGSGACSVSMTIAIGAASPGRGFVFRMRR